MRVFLCRRQTRPRSCPPQATRRCQQETPEQASHLWVLPVPAWHRQRWEHSPLRPDGERWAGEGQHRAHLARGKVLCDSGIDHISVCLWLICSLYKLLKKINLAPLFKRCQRTILWSLTFLLFVGLVFFSPDNSSFLRTVIIQMSLTSLNTLGKKSPTQQEWRMSGGGSGIFIELSVMSLRQGLWSHWGRLKAESVVFSLHARVSWSSLAFWQCCTCQIRSRFIVLWGGRWSLPLTLPNPPILVFISRKE